MWLKFHTRSVPLAKSCDFHVKETLMGEVAREVENYHYESRGHIVKAFFICKSQANYEHVTCMHNHILLA
jgi:hypothetical protein